MGPRTRRIGVDVKSRQKIFLVSGKRLSGEKEQTDGGGGRAHLTGQ